VSTHTITFLGGVESVTGSRFLLETDNFKLLVEAGMFQGLKELRLKNWEPFPINPAEINAIIITHADADEVCEWLGTNKTAPTHTFIVHGEPASSAAMAEKINSQIGWNTVVPKSNQKFYL
jgi:Cft2 family RNA processing exonuclease